jgi:hypothetical protein
MMELVLVVLLLAGLGAQVLVLAEIRRRHKLAHRAEAATLVGALACVLGLVSVPLTWVAAAVVATGLVNVAHQLRTAPVVVRLDRRPHHAGEDLRH